MKTKFVNTKTLVFFIVIFAMLFSGCAPKATQTVVPAATAPAATMVPATQTATPEKVLVVAAALQQGESFDIINVSQTMEPHVMVYETLVTLDYKYQFQPGLADSWDISADGLTWTFHLRHGVKFQDGSDFNAQVIEWWIGKMKTGSNSYIFDPLTGSKVIDDYTIDMSFNGPYPNLLFDLASSFASIPSMKLYESCGDKYGTTPECTAGTGPFKLQEWVQNDHLTLVKNPDYNWAPEWTKHQGPANVDKIIYRIIPEDATRAIEFEAGNVDLLISPPTVQQLAVYSADPNYFVLQAPSPTLQFIGMNLGFPLLKDLRTRKAIGYAIDRDLILKTLYQGIGNVRTTYLAKELGVDQAALEIAPSYDPAKAKELLAEVGWVPGKDGILVAKTVEGVAPGTKFEVTYMTYQQDEFSRLAEATQKMLSDIGIKADIQLMDNTTYSAALHKPDQVQLILRQYQWDNGDILEWFHHSKNLPYPDYLGVKDPQLDAMLDDANYKTVLWADRSTKYIAIQKYDIDTLYPWAPIRQTAMVLVGHKWVTNVLPIPLKILFSTGFWTVVDIQK